MKKGILKSFTLIASLAMIIPLVACEDKPATVTYGGLTEKELKVFDSVNVKSSITVVDSNGNNLLSSVKATTETEGCVLTESGILNLADSVKANALTSPKVCVIKYSVPFGGKDVTATKNFKFVEGITKITFTGVDPVTVRQNDEFVVMKDVTAKGDNNRDVTSLVQTSIVSETGSIVDGKLNTSVIGTYTIKYTVAFTDVNAQVERVVKVVDANEKVDLMADRNGDFSNNSLTGWNVYLEGSSTGVLSYDAELQAMKFDITVVGGNSYSNRLDFMNIPFKKGQLYTITFRVKASVDGKRIYPQTGELLTADPWFTKFGKDYNFDGKKYFVASTEWKTITMVYKHEVDNPRGGLVLEMGTVDGSAIPCTIWYDDFKVVETDSVSLTSIALTIPGDITVKQDELLEVMTGVEALGDDTNKYTDKVTVEASNGVTITDGKLDTSAIGEVTLTYSVVVGSVSATKTRKVTIVSKDTIVNLVQDGSFDDSTLSKWGYGADGASKFERSVTEKGLTIVMNASGSTQAYQPQITQANVPITKEKKYVVKFTASSTMDRRIDMRLQEMGGSWPTLCEIQANLTSTPTVFEKEFTVWKAPGAAIQIGFMLGKVADTAPQGEHTVYIDDVMIYVVEDLTVPTANPDNLFGNDLTDPTTLVMNSGEQETIPNNKFNFWLQTWDPIAQATATIGDGKFTVNITNAPAENWSIQFFYLTYRMPETGNYVLSFDVEAQNSRTIRVNGQDFVLEQGINHITLNATNVAAGASFAISAQIGNWATGIDEGTYVFSNFQLVKAQ